MPGQGEEKKSSTSIGLTSMEKGAAPLLEKDVISGKTVMYVMCLLYKMNMLTRNNLSHLFKIIKETPDNFDNIQYLVNEEARKS